MSPEAWGEFWHVTADLLWDMVRFIGVGVWIGWHWRGRRDRKRQNSPS